jgi:hypothetical protein
LFSASLKAFERDPPVLANLTIGGDLDLSNVHLVNGLVIRNSRFDGLVDLNGARSDGTLDFVGSSFARGITAAMAALLEARGVIHEVIVDVTTNLEGATTLKE